MSSVARNDFRGNPTRFAFAVISTLIALAPPASSSDGTEEAIPEVSTRSIRRAEGLAYVDLPMQIRARFDMTYRNDDYVSDTLARPYVTTTGPEIARDDSLESRFALTRALSDRVEVGIVWGARSPVSQIDLFDFERQTVGAMIRFVP